MKKVQIEELREGDEIIIASGSKLKYLKVLKNPTLSDKKIWKKGVTVDRISLGCHVYYRSPF